eukprot:8528456-Pyramimonas_sp.AAC.1
MPTPLTRQLPWQRSRKRQGQRRRYPSYNLQKRLANEQKKPSEQTQPFRRPLSSAIGPSAPWTWRSRSRIMIWQSKQLPRNMIN